MSFVKAGGFRGLQSDSDDIKIDTSGNVAFINNNIVNKNLLINGGMNVWQRSTSASSLTSNGYHSVDRWQSTIGAIGTWTQSRSTDVPSDQGFSYSLKMDCTAADASPASTDLLIIRQQIEGQNLQHLLKGSSSAKSLTLSFWVKSNKTGTYVAELQDTDNSRAISKSYTVDSANTWEKKTITYDGDTTGTLNNDNDDSLHVLFWLGAGTNYTSGSLQTSWAGSTDVNKAVGQVNLADSTSNEWYITGCQLEVGENASGFEFEPFSTTENKCMRYYEVSARSAMGVLTMGPSRNDATQVDAFIAFKVRKRATPGVSESGVSFNTNGNISTQGTRQIDNDGFNTAYILNGNQTSYASKNGTYKADAEL